MESIAVNRSLTLAAGLLVVGAALAQQSAPTGGVVGPVVGLEPDHATLSVADLAVEAHWYESVLGFKVFSKSESDPNYINWHLALPNGYRMDLIKATGSTRPPLPPRHKVYLQQGWVHVSFHVKDVVAALQTMQALHVDVLVNKRDEKGNPVQLRLTDPEGNEVEVRRNLVI